MKRWLFLTVLVGGLPVGPRLARAVDVHHPAVPTFRMGPGTIPVRPDPEAQARVAALPTASRPWMATWDLDTGRVRMLYNGETAPLPGNLETQARWFLRAQASLFGFADLSDLGTLPLLSHGLGQTIRFQQRYHGLRVVPGDVAVSRNPAGRIFLVSSEYRPGLDLDPAPAISAAEARQRAGRAAGGRPGPAELIVWALSRPYLLAWQVDVDVRRDEQDRVLLDARNGRLLTRYNRVSLATDPMATVYLGDPVTTPQTTTVPLPNLDGSGHLTGAFVAVKKFISADAQGNPQGSVDLQAQNGGFVLPANDPRIDQTMMYFHVNRMHDYYHNTFNYTQRDGVMSSYVEVANPDGSPLNNAYYSPTCDCIEFGFTNSKLDFALDGDVIRHEYTHSVVNTLNQIGNNDRWTEARALNEALADYFSATVGNSACLGAYMTGKTDGSCFRDLSNRRHYPEEVDTTQALQDGSLVYLFPEEHYTGEIWSGAMWDLRRSVGAQIADKILFTSLPLYPTAALFADARVAAQTADQQLGTGAGTTLGQILDNRGIAAQAQYTYAQPNQFSPDNQRGVWTGFISPQGGPFSPQGFIPAFVSGRSYGFTGFLDGFTGTKVVSFVMVNQANNQAQQFKADLASVMVQDGNGQQIPVTRFQVEIQPPAGSEGTYKMGFAESTDGMNFDLPITVTGQVIKDAGPVPDPPKEVITTPQPVPTTTPTPTPVPTPAAQPASIQVQPAQVTVAVGNQARLTATVVDSAGQVVPGAAVTWSFQGPAGAATISPDGILSARQQGQGAAVARIGAIQGQAQVTITPAVAAPNIGSWQQVPGSEKGLVLSLSASSGGGADVVYEAGLDSVKISVNGQPFQPVIAGLDPSTLPTSIAADPGSPAVVYLGTLNVGLFRSQDGGQTWFQYAQDLAAALGGFFADYPEIASVAADAQDEIAIGTVDQGTYVRLGTTQPWLDVSTGLSTATIYSFVLNTSATALFAGSNAGAYRIRTDEPTWSAIDNGLTTNGFEGQNHGLPPSVNRIALNPLNEKELMAATPTDGVFLSENEGDAWSQNNNGLNDTSVLTVVFDPAVRGRLFAGTKTGGVFVSTDGGGHWQSVSAGLPIGTIPALAFDAANPNHLYAGTFGEGVWMLDLTNSGGTGSLPGTPVPGGVLLLGDINGDGKVNVQDATLALQIAVGLVAPTAAQKVAGDFNGDGQVNVQDATLLLRKAVGL